MAIGWLIMTWILFLALIALVIRAAWQDKHTMDIREERILTPAYAAEAEPAPTPAPVPEPTPTPEVWNRYLVPLDDDMQKHIIKTAREHEIDPCIVFAVIGVVTGGTYDPALVGDNGNSFGLMQIRKSCHEDRMERLGATDLFAPYQNVTVGVDILAELLDYYDGDMDRALSFYHGNGGSLPDAYADTVQTNAELLAESVQTAVG